MPLKTAFEDHQHRFWVASHQGLYLLDRVTGRYTLVPVPGLTGPQPSFLSFYLDKEDVLWIGAATAGYSVFKLDLRRQPGTQSHIIQVDSLIPISGGIQYIGIRPGSCG